MTERDETIELRIDEADGPGEGPPEESATGDYRVRLDAFEGPLDLLLYLIKKEEVSIYDIPIARLTEQYLEYVRVMQELDIDLAGEFLVMAATLIHIKTKMLLPRDPIADAAGEELEDPRHELVERLLEHQRYRTAAGHLHERMILEREVFARPLSEEEQENVEVKAGVFDLLTAFRDVLMRAQALVEIEIARDEVTLAEMLIQVQALIDTHEAVNVRELFERARSRRELVITFLAVLELVKEQRIRIVQSGAFGEIEARRRELEPTEIVEEGEEAVS